MEIKRFASKIIVRCDKDDEIVQTITKVCSENNVKLASITGIGAVNEATIGLFNPTTREYHSMQFKKDMEIAGLAGNVSRMNDEVYIHAHITLTDSSYNAIGGHLSYAKVSCTAELIIDVIDGEVNRSFNDEVGLNLLQF